MQSLNEMLDDNSVSDVAVFLAPRDALELGLHSVHLRHYDDGFFVRQRVLQSLHAMTRFYSLHTISILILLTEVTCFLVTSGNRHSDMKRFLESTGNILFAGRNFIGRRLHAMSCRNPGVHNQVFWLLHCVAAARGLVLISFQLNAGIRRRKHANKKLLCFPPKVQDAMRRSVALTNASTTIALFLCMQFIIAYTPLASCMCSLYCLVGRSATYMGKSEHQRATALGTPLARGVEHLFELFFSNQPQKNRKSLAFRYETLVDFSQYYLFSVPTDLAAKSEKILIKISAATANTIHRSVGLCMRASVRRRPAKARRWTNNIVVAHSTTCNKHWVFAERPETFEDKMPLTTLINLPFRQLYFHVLSQKRFYGPLSIFLRPLLLVSFVSRPKHVLDCAEFAKYLCGKTLFQASRLVDKIRSRLFRSVATARLNSLLNLFGETKICKFVWHVPWPCAVSDVSSALEKHWRLIGRNRRMRFRHVCSMLCLVQKRSLTYKDFCNMIRVARQMDAKSLLHEPCSHRLSAWSGKTFRQLKLYHELRQPVDAGKLFRDLSENMREFLCFARSSDACFKLVLGELVSLCEQAVYKHTCMAWPQEKRNVHSQFVMPCSHEVLVVEDKDPAAAWLIPIRDYCLSILHLLEKEVAKWELTTLSIADAWQFKKSAFDMVWRAGFGPARGHEVTLDSLPYLYATIKAKCFRSGCRVCSRDAHSCMRKIVSYACLEKNWRALFRRVSRATMILIMRLGFGDEVASLSLAASTLRRRCRALVVPQQPLRRCLKCCGAKCALEMLVADAGAMYEAIDSQFVLVCLDFFLELAAELGYTGVAVFRTKKLHGYLAKHNFHQHNNVDLVSFEQIKAIHMLGLNQKLVTVGNLVYRQRRGVPIGGLLSKCQTSLVLCAEECIWNTNIGKQNAFGALEHLQWKQQVAACRYVDDCCLVSPYFCTSCFFACLTGKSCVDYERQNSSCTHGDWLDMDVSCAQDTVTINLSKQEQEWIDGLAQQPKRFRIPPFCGDNVLDAKTRISGAQARLAQIYLDNKGSVCNGNYVGLVEAIHYMMNIWNRSGHPVHYTRQTWCRYLTNPIFARAATAWRQ